MPTKTSSQTDNDLKILEEGAAKFYLYDKDTGSIPTKSMSVFYNRKMKLNRYISNLAVNAYRKRFHQEKLNIVTTMAASGISAIRMLLECEKKKKMVINDINPLAIDLINKNLKLNDLPRESQEISVTRKDANYLCNEFANKKLTHPQQFQSIPNIISIDPFGSPNLYLDAAFKAIIPWDGLLCVTATDTAVLFGVKPKACRRKYMSRPLHNEFCKEVGTRILLYLISRIANLNDMGVLPLLTFYSNHFIRVFLLTLNKKKEIFNHIKTYGYIFYCDKCGHRFTTDSNILNKPKRCELCDNPLQKYAGPLWTGELHDKDFIEELLSLNSTSEFKIKKRVETTLQFCLEECAMPPFYYNIHKICKELHRATVPSMDLLLKEIKKRGYSASRTNFDFTSIKTNMNIEELKRLMLEL